MSDTEQDVRRRMSDSSSASSADDDSSLANKKTSKAKELDNSGFRVDGEPMNKPRKDDDSSDSDSDSEGGPDNVSEDEEDSSSLSKPAAARKRTVDDSSTESSAPAKSKEVEDEDDDSSSETADDVSKSLDDVVDEDEQAPVTAAVKPDQEIDEEPAEVEAEATGKPEIEAEASPVASPPVQRVPSVQVNEVDSDSDSEEGPDEADSDKEEEPKEETPAPVVQEEPMKEPEPAVEPEPKPRVNGTEIKRPQFRHSSSSLSDEEIPIAASPAPTAVSPAPALSSPAPAAAASVSPVAGSAGLEDRKKEFLAAASSPATPPPPASQSPLPTRANASALTKIYTGAIESNNNESNHNENEKPRSKPAKDITQIYKAGIANKTATPPSSPKPVPSRNRDITQLYTGGFQKGQNNKNSASPCMAADKLNPSKHNMSTAVDRDAIRQAYDDVRSDTSDTQWAVFKFDESNRLKAAGTGKDFKDFKGSFSNEDRGFGYIRINTGDEMSKRAKFVFVTWVGPSVSVMKKAKMSTDKALMKDIIQNMSVELQFENHAEFSQDFFKSQVDKAAGARYGTGERAL